jgi:RNA polymerase sigma-70 factor (ECF subfamily)
LRYRRIKGGISKKEQAARMDFEEIYQKYSPRIYRVCMGYVNDHEQARDLTQETFISVWRNLSGFKQQSAVSTWIFRIATNNCLRALERSKRIIKTELPFNLAAPEEENTEGQLKMLYDCIAELAEPERIIISLVLEDLPQVEIAEIVGLSHANVRVKIHRIKEKLATKLKRYGQPG